MAKSKPTPSKRTRPIAAAEIEPKPRSAPAIGSYEAALEYLHGHVNFEKRTQRAEDRHEYRLDRMRAILEALDNPQKHLRCVHVAGTKGKGSTCEMVASGLEACGYTVGIYTSPHLLDLRERIRINRRPISQDALTSGVAQLAKAAAAVQPSHGPATFFELLTALGFLHFAQQAVDAAVIEVGLGGLLDCTNVINPEVAAITSIGLDHMAILGDTVEEIAAQKAGIFKPGVPALAIQQDPKITKVFRETAARIGAPIQIVGEDIEFSFRFEWQAGLGPTARVNLSTERSNFEHVPVPLRGEHQALNCGLALAILDKLSERGFVCPENKVVRGLEDVRLPGRFELVVQSPRILVDVAHNPDSIKALVKTIGAYMQYDSLVVVFGCSADKDSESMLRNLATGADKVIFTQADTPRAVPAAELARKFHDLSGKVAHATKSTAEAMDLALRAINRGDLVCITGSFYTCGEAKKWIADRLAAKAARR